MDVTEHSETTIEDKAEAITTTIDPKEEQLTLAQILNSVEPLALKTHATNAAALNIGPERVQSRQTSPKQAT